jgi:hypothetical protein
MAEAPRPNREFKVVALLEAIRRETVLRIHNGEITERKLARIVGISQPQMHNVLKGCRTLKPEIADLLIAQLCIPAVSLGIGMTKDYRATAK